MHSSISYSYSILTLIPLGFLLGDASSTPEFDQWGRKSKAEREWVWGVYFPDYFLAGSSGFAVSLPKATVLSGQPSPFNSSP